MYDVFFGNLIVRSFSSEPKLLFEISRTPEHVATSIEYVKKIYGRANL